MGHYLVIGRYDPGTDSFHLTRPVLKADSPAAARLLPQPPGPAESIGTPCPEPAGGWRVLDTAKTTMTTQDAALAAAERLPTYAGSWLDQSRNPADPEKEPELMNDPTKLILNVKVTTDAAGAERTLRTIWGGMMCVSQGGRPEAQLRRILSDLSGGQQVLGSAIDTSTSTVELTVTYDDGTIQRAVDARYGPGVVRVTGQLQPYPG